MTDHWHGTSDPQPPDPGRSAMGAWLSWAGALTSLGLVAGLSVWAYQLTIRDVSEIPVIRAQAGPMRVAPQDPGGERAAHQGLAVNSVAADGQAADVADRLILAPRPLTLTDEDLAGAELSLARATPPEVPGTAVTGRRAPAPAQAENPAPEAGLADDPDAGPADPEGEGLTLVPPTVPGIARSPRPTLRPDADLAALSVAARVAESVAENLVSRGGGGVDPASLEPGTRLVQLGAFESEAIALEEWARVKDRFSDVLEDRERVIEKAESGGKTFYRLRVVGFDGLSDARRLCAVLTAEKANCIPVVTR